ncbi:bacteriorhodopsin [Natronomonas marina]|uniref:bacteriorhodopsin n=1 Tax=Natronomonas marina TaxID=2961939 RepID=UPI003D9CAC45
MQAAGELGVEGEGVWLALGTVLMLLGMVYFIAQGWGVQDPRQKEFYIITILIPGIAAASYLSMFFGFGLTEVPLTNGRVVDVYWARYADWLFTTPLLLLDIGLLAGASNRDIGALVGLDAFMIVTGLAATLMKVPIARYAFWTISTIAMLFLLYFLFVVFSEAASDLDEDSKSTFNVLRNLILVTWALYPIVWLVGTEGVAAVGLFTETLLFMVLDVTAKVGFGFILLRSRAIVGEESAPTPSSEEAAAD